MKLRKFLSLLLTLAMVLPMALPVSQAAATETEATEVVTETTEATEATETVVEELPTGTKVVNIPKKEGEALAKSWDFSDESQLADFSLYQSATSAFTVTDGVLVPDGTDGEVKAILTDTPDTLQSVSVDILPGESGNIYGGVYFGASNAANGQDQINSQVFLIKSNYDPAGWSDAINRVDVVQGEFDNGWKHIKTVISETGNGNALFRGSKQPLNLKLRFSGDVVLLTLSLVSNSSKYVQMFYECDASLVGQIGLRVLNSDTKFDNLQITYKGSVMEHEMSYDFETSDQLSDFTLYRDVTLDAGQVAMPGTGTNKSGGELVLNEKYHNIKSLYVEISQVNTKMIGGFYLGGLDIVIMAGGAQGNANGHFVYSTYTSATHTINGEGLSTYGSFFSGKDSREPISLTLTFEQDKIIAAMARLDGGKAAVTKEYAVDTTKFNGVIGLINQNAGILMDNLKISYYESIPDGPVSYDFETSDQLSDFTLYRDITLNAGQVVMPSPGGDKNGGEMVLKGKFHNIKSLYVEISQANTKMIGGFYLGGLDIVIMAGGAQGNANGHFVYSTYTNHTINRQVLSGYGSFFSGKNSREPISLTLTFGEDKIIATMARLDGGKAPVTKEYAVDTTKFNGVIGLVNQNAGILMDNLAITFDESSVTKTGYVNEGADLHTTAWSWDLTKGLSATPYTAEAWVKVPEGISVGGKIISSYRYPGIELEMTADGKPMFAWKTENEDKSTASKTFTAEYDLRTGEWTHIAFVCDVEAQTVTCYINGEQFAVWENAEVDDFTLPDGVLVENIFSIGTRYFCDNTRSGYKFWGWIADVRMWNDALSAEQIQASMMTQYTQPKESLLFNAPMNETVDGVYKDLSGNDNYVEKYVHDIHFLGADNSEPGDFSIVVIPDQQMLSRYYPDSLNNMYQWIADNREKENIQFVLNVGDFADQCGVEQQWINSKTAWELLPDDLPFIGVPGNHDFDTNSGWNTGYGKLNQLTLMNKYFPLDLFRQYTSYGGSYSEDRGLADNCADQWHTFQINGNDYLVITLQFGPGADELAWANEVVASHPNHQVIVITHAYLHDAGYFSTYQYIWDDFIKQHENIVMAINGNNHSEYIMRRTDKGLHNNDVFSMLMDMQCADLWYENGLGMLGILRFNADGTECRVSYYSTVHETLVTEINQFTFNLPKQEHKYSALVGLESYETVTEAAANANGETVQILKNTDEAITINADLTIDLAGYTLSNVTVAEGVKLNLIDSTADYSGTKGSATVTGTVERFTVNGDDKYMVIGENGVYAPHKYYVGITHVSLDTNVTGFGYKAGFYGDAAVQAQIANIGYELWLTEDHVVTRTLDKFQNVVTLRLKNFLVESYGEAPVNAKAVITLTDGTKLESAVNSYSMRSMIELLNDSAADFEVAQLQNVAMFIKKNPVMENWNVANILAVLQPAANVQAITVTDQSMTLVDGTTGTFTLNGAYQFTAQDTEQTVAYSDYAGWVADYYITMDAEAAEGLYLAGNYGDYGWIAIPVESGKTYTNVPVVQTLLGTSLTYEEMVTDVVSFSCGVADTQSLNTGATVTVELRLTNPENPEEILTLNTTTLTLA